MGCQGSRYQWFDGTFEEAKAAADSKLIFLKFYTNTWAACFRLDVETLRDSLVQTFSKENFISLKYNANEKIGNQYFKQYNCQGVPHLLFVDSEGEEVDRIIGFLPPTEYLLRIEDIALKRNTLSDYLLQYKNGTVNAAIIAGIAMKYEDRKENDKDAKFYSILINDYPDPSSEYYKQGKFFLASHEFINGNDNALKNYVIDTPDSPFHFDAYRKMVFYYADTEQREKELAAYWDMLLLFPDDPSALNSYAWRMAEIETNLEDALEKVRKAVVITADDPDRRAGIIDTEAEVLWKMNRYNEAIEAIERSISIDPENQYYKDQKEKFIESKRTESQSV